MTRTGRPRGPTPTAEQRADERAAIISAVATAGGSRKLAAAALGYTERRLYARITALGITELTPPPPRAPPRQPVVIRDPSDAALVEQAIAIVHTGREVGRRIGTTDARVSLIRAGKAHLTAKQRTRLEAMLASPPVDVPAPGPQPSTTADGELLDAARALPQVGTYAALATLLGVTAEHLSRVRAGRSSLSVGKRAKVREILQAAKKK